VEKNIDSLCHQQDVLLCFDHGAHPLLRLSKSVFVFIRSKYLATKLRTLRID